MIFLTATACPVSWSLAELDRKTRSARATQGCVDCDIPNEAKGAHSDGLEIGIPARRE